MSYETLTQLIHDCKACPLGFRGAGVPGEYVTPGGSRQVVQAMVILEAPNAIEQEIGRPVWGESGQLFRTLMEECGVTDYYVTNIAKHRPLVVKGKQQPPDSVAIKACSGYLEAEMKMVQPSKIIVCGKTAAKEILNLPGNPSQASLVNRVHDRDGVPVLVLYHPAFFLHNRTAVWVRKQMNDWKRALRNFMGETIPTYAMEQVVCPAHG